MKQKKKLMIKKMLNQTHKEDPGEEKSAKISILKQDMIEILLITQEDYQDAKLEELFSPGQVTQDADGQEVNQFTKLAITADMDPPEDGEESEDASGN